jgi:hypothetical protein
VIHSYGRGSDISWRCDPISSKSIALEVHSTNDCSFPVSNYLPRKSLKVCILSIPKPAFLNLNGVFWMSTEGSFNAWTISNVARIVVVIPWSTTHRSGRYKSTYIFHCIGIFKNSCLVESNRSDACNSLNSPVSKSWVPLESLTTILCSWPTCPSNQATWVPIPTMAFWWRKGRAINSASSSSPIPWFL